MSIDKKRLEYYTKTMYFALASAKHVDELALNETKAYNNYTSNSFKKTTLELGKALHTYLHITIPLLKWALKDINMQSREFDNLAKAIDDIEIEINFMLDWTKNPEEDTDRNRKWYFSSRENVKKTCDLCKKVSGCYCKIIKTYIAKESNTSDFNIAIDNACKMYLDSEGINATGSTLESKITSLWYYLDMDARYNKFTKLEFNDDVTKFKNEPKKKLLWDSNSLTMKQIQGFITSYGTIIRRHENAFNYYNKKQNYYSKYLSYESTLNEYLLHEFNSTGLDYGTACKMTNMMTGSINPPQNKSYIRPEKYPKLKEHLENFKKIHDNYNKAVDLSLYYYSYLIENDVKSIRTSYIVNEQLNVKRDMLTTFLINNEEFIKNTYNNKDLELHEYSKQIEVNRTINNDRYRKPFDDRLYTIANFCIFLVNDYFVSRYEKFNQNGWNSEFNLIMDNAMKEYEEDLTEKDLDLLWKKLDLPTRTHKFKPFVYVEVPNESTPSKVTKTETKTKNTVKTKVEEPKDQKEDPNKVYNILDICEKTKLGKGYLVTKVPNVCTKLLIDDKVIEISPNALMNCSKLKQITLGKNLKVIPKELFNMLRNLEVVNFVEGLEVIETNAFYETGITGNITLPNSLKEIKHHAFDVKLPTLLKVTVSKDTIYYDDSFHSLIEVNGETGKQRALRKEKDKNVSKTNNFESKKAPVKLSQITEVIEKNGKRIAKNLIECAENVIVDDDIDEINDAMFTWYENLEQITLGKNLKVIEFGTFVFKESLKTVKFVEGLEEIRYAAFQQSGLCGEIVLPKSLKCIGSQAFMVKKPENLKVYVYEKTEYETDTFSEKTIIEKYK